MPRFPFGCVLLEKDVPQKRAKIMKTLDIPPVVHDGATTE
jgi:hypothetical protein